MAFRRSSILLICSLILSGAVFAAEIDQEATLRFGLGGEVSVLNPILSTDTSSSAVEGAIFTGMVKFNEKLDDRGKDLEDLESHEFLDLAKECDMNIVKPPQ